MLDFDQRPISSVITIVGTIWLIRTIYRLTGDDTFEEVE